MLVKLTYDNGVTEIVDPVESGLVTADELGEMNEMELCKLFFGTAGEHGIPIDVEIDDTADRLEQITNAPVRWDRQLRSYVVNRGGRADDEYGWTPVTDAELEEAIR